MTILLVQTFLLLLLAFLLGASLACLIRRGFSDGTGADAPTAAAWAASAGAPATAGLDTGRFERALVGGEGRGVPPVFHGQPTGPVVEVQPRAAEPALEPEAAPAPPPRPKSKLPPAPQPPPPVELPFTPVAAPRPPAPAPEPVALAPEPVAAPAPAPEPPVVEPAPKPPVESERPTVIAPAAAKEPSYTEIAAAAAAAAAAAEAQKPAPPSEPSYAEIAIAAAAAAAAAAASKAPTEVEAAVTPAPAEPEPSRFGTPVESEAAPIEGDDLTRIHTIDAALKDRLNRLGIHRFAEIAGWRASDVLRFSQSLGLSGRIEQENWVGQAQILARGGAIESAQPRERAAPVAAAAPVDGAHLHRIIGVDPESEAVLLANGVTSLADIAGWSADDIARFESLIGQPGRITRENWVGQAYLLIRGAASAAGTPMPVPAPAPPPAPAATGARTDYTGLRSVKSEALLGDAAPYVPPSGEVDDLKRIRGIGVLIEKKLHSLGITRYEQLANWTGADVDRISQVLDFKGRIERENWIEQARILASGGQTEFSRRADRGEV